MEKACFVSSDDEDICSMNRCNFNYEEHAQLIASAPDLLEACKYASELLVGHNLQHHNVYTVLQQAINQAEKGG